MKHSPLIILALIAVLSSCVAFRPTQETLLTATGAEETRLGPAYLQRKQTVELEGTFRDGEFLISRIEIEEPDDEVQIKSTLKRVDVETGKILVGDVWLDVVGDSKLLDRNGGALTLVDLRDRVGEFAKAESIARAGALRLRKIQLRDRADGEADELQGNIKKLDRKARRLEIDGVPASYRRDVVIVWDVQDTAPPPPTERAVLELDSVKGLRRLIRIDDDDQRPEDQLTVGDFLTIGGEISYDLEYRDNHDLRNDRHRDRFLQTPSAKLELSFDLDDHVFAFTSVGLRRTFVIFDEDRDLEFDTDVSLEEAWVLITDWPGDGFGLQVGRQDFDHGREWVMDDQFEAVRTYFNFEFGTLELSAGTVLIDASPEEEGVVNYIAGLHLRPFEELDSDVFLYGFHRNGGDLIDLDRWHAGVSAEVNIGDFVVWADFGYVTGREDDLEVEGFGFDLAMMYVFEDFPLEPSIYGGVAWGEGDDDVSDGKDSSFRQTGLQDNNDRFNGVTSFRYLGELVRPELSNLLIFTLGFGIRPLAKTSVDFVFHHYTQAEARAGSLRDTRIRLDTTGLSDKLGVETDIVIGFDHFEPVDVELVLAWFRPGPAFGATPDDAWFMTLEIEYNF